MVAATAVPALALKAPSPKNSTAPNAGGIAAIPKLPVAGNEARTKIAGAAPGANDPIPVNVADGAIPSDAPAVKAPEAANAAVL
jgi:hypothetical protein